MNHPGLHILARLALAAVLLGGCGGVGDQLDLTDKVEVVDTADSLDVSDQLDTAAPRDTLDVVDTSAPLDVSDQLDTAAPRDTLDVVDTSAPLDVSDQLDTAASGDTADVVVYPADTVDLTDAADPVDVEDPADTVDLVEVVEVVEVVDPADTVDLTDTVDLVEVLDPVDTFEPVDTGCAPFCLGKNCGPDGCGGVCGDCAGGFQCDPAGMCRRACSGAICPTLAGHSISCNSAGLCRYQASGGWAWVALPGGTFDQGCSPLDGACLPSEFPVRRVTLSPFRILEAEVTEKQYLTTLGSNPSCHYNGAAGDNLPVECVTWAHALAFCQAIGGRLPTEAQWEYAARAGTTSTFTCGEAPACLDALAWTGANSGAKKQVVKTKAPNAFGLYDLLGNVWEWTADWFGDTYGPGGAVTDPEGAPNGTLRVRRGGSFVNVDDLRVSLRLGDNPLKGVTSVGIRCVRK